MRRYYGITAPVWIFLFTLFLVVATGGIVGTSPCERTVTTCETSAVAAHSNNLTLQEAYVSRCSEAACKSQKSGAAVPFSILVLGYVLYRVWTRQGDTGTPPSPARRSATGAAPSTAPKKAAGTRAKEELKEEPEKTPKDAARATPSASKRKSRTKAPDGPDTVTAEAGAKAPEKATGKASGKGPTLTPAQKTLYLGTLYFDEDTPKGDVARRLSELTGATDASVWKGAPASDLALLAKAIAAAAALDGATSKYRDPNGGEAPTDAVAEMTKKALYEQSLETLQTDLDALGKNDFPEGLSKASVDGVTSSLRGEDALDGLSRLSKSALVSLALFLDVS